MKAKNIIEFFPYIKEERGGVGYLDERRKDRKSDTKELESSLRNGTKETTTWRV